jgi:hypothetical protein
VAPQVWLAEHRGLVAAALVAAGFALGRGRKAT